MKSGKEGRNKVRREKDKARRLEVKATQNADGRNTVPGRRKRVASVDANGKRFFELITLDVGDVVPKPLKRKKSHSDVLLNSVLSKIKTCTYIQTPIEEGYIYQNSANLIFHMYSDDAYPLLDISQNTKIPLKI
jgi:hypothetical protein